MFYDFIAQLSNNNSTKFLYHDDYSLKKKCYLLYSCTHVLNFTYKTKS